ncbi:plasmid recombination protein [Bacteroidales bacterium OttesenSCG-928-L03]|nr:plasmid recombination protein [Bacteroidales bacterium OttesenSCG-928-L03]
MGYVVFHLDKSPGNESAMTDHIERKVIHPNVDPERVHLNKELVEFPDGIKNRTEAIQHRLDTARLKRQIGKNQVKVIRVMISGSPEDMKRIESEGKLDDWCRDNMDYLKKTFGEENLVAATLHMDETTPHIHASIVPIVRGERRQKKPKKKPEEDNQAQKPNEGQKPKRTYKKKDPNMPRLCVDDVMAREKLIEYQDTYAAAMAKYGLERGIKGSDARHITLTEHYRNQTIESNNLQINIEQLLAVEEAKRQRIEELIQKEQEAKNKSVQAEEKKQQKESELKKTEDSLNQVKGQLKTEKFKNKVADVGSNVIDGLGSLVGASKVKRQQQEIENLKEAKETLIREVKSLKQDIQTIQKEHQATMNKLKQELKKIHDLFPILKELLWIERLLQVMRFSEDLIKEIMKMNPIGFKGSIYSTEYQRSFKTEYSVAEIKEHPKEKDKLQLTIDGISDTNWFRMKHKEFQESMGIKFKQKPEMGKNKGLGM